MSIYQKKFATWDAVQSLKIRMSNAESSITALNTSVTALNLTVGQHGTRLDSAETRMSDIEAVNTAQTNTLINHASRLQILEAGGGGGGSGANGLSAYEIAIQNGFVGTEAQWLASLVGPQGEPGITTWAGITGKPTNLAGYGIEEEVQARIDASSGGGGGGAAAAYSPINKVPLSDIATTSAAISPLTGNGGSGTGYAFVQFTVSANRTINRFGFPALTALSAGTVTLKLRNVTANITMYEEVVLNSQLENNGVHWIQTIPTIQALSPGATYEIRMDFVGANFDSTRTIPYSTVGAYSRVHSEFSASGAGSGTFPAWRIQSGRFQGVEGNLSLASMPTQGLTTVVIIGGVTLTYTNGLLTGVS